MGVARKKWGLNRNSLDRMAPRARRTPKLGLRRIDAAFDALRPMGFPDDVVRKTIRCLLKAYGGDDGWIFVEECSYQLVIDTILQEQANPEQEKLVGDCSLKNDSLEDEPGTQPCPSRVHLPQNDNLEDEPGTQPYTSPVHSPQNYSTQVHSPLVTCPAPGMDSIPCSLKDETSQDMIGRQFPSPLSSSAGDPLHMQLPSPVNSQRIRNRKPCYGWISSDDEEDLVYLPPAINRASELLQNLDE